ASLKGLGEDVIGELYSPDVRRKPDQALHRAARHRLSSRTVAERVMIMNLNPGTVTGWFFQSIVDLVLHDREHAGHVSHVRSRIGGPQMSVMRNFAVEEMLETDARWLWFLDSDIQFAPDTLDRLLAIADADERPVVSAMYMMVREGVLMPCLY